MVTLTNMDTLQANKIPLQLCFTQGNNIQCTGGDVQGDWMCSYVHNK